MTAPPDGLEQMVRVALMMRRIHAKDVAAAAGVTGARISQVLKGRKQLSPPLALVLERCTGLEASMLIRLDHERQLTRRLEELARLRKLESHVVVKGKAAE